MKPAEVIPRHVQACLHSPVKHERWAIWTWARDKPSIQTRVPYQCQSWRCPVCRRHEAAVCFSRIKEAVDPLPADGWVFLVLTLDRNAYFGGRKWVDVNEAYAELGRMTRSTLGRIGRVWGPETAVERCGRSRELRTVRKLGNRWVAVVEAHRSGWPHCNVMLWAPELAAELRRSEREALEDPEVADAVALSRECWRDKLPVPASVREKARRASLVGGALRDLLTEAGWGRQSTAEAARSADAVAGYVVKVAGLHDDSAGELAKVTQVPMTAPQRFRRLRSGRGFLPPRRKNPAVTGCLILSQRTSAGGWKVRQVNAPMLPEQFEPTRSAVRCEVRLIADEAFARRRATKKPVTAFDGWLVSDGTRRRLLALSAQVGEHFEGTSEQVGAMSARKMACAG